MNYTIGELSKIMNVSIHTLRYYDNEGLLPFVPVSYTHLITLINKVKTNMAFSSAPNLYKFL